MSFFTYQLPQVSFKELQSIPEIAALATCQQDQAYHSEGNVLAHTERVCQALKEDLQWKLLDEEHRFITYTAALLHDIGKPRTTRVDQDGRLSSHGHAAKGSLIARRLLYEAGVEFTVREQITGLLRWHGLPPRILDKRLPIRSTILASTTCRCDLLAMVAKADAMGRDNPTSAYFEGIDLFTQQAKELKCWQQPYVFHSDHSRFQYFLDETKSPGCQIYDDTKSSVILMSGLPGAGKNTWIKGNLKSVEIISLDEIRARLGVDPSDNQGTVIQAAREQARILLRDHKDFVWNATNISRQLRGSLISLFDQYKAKVNIVYLETPYSTLFKRNQTRDNPVPEKVLNKLIDNLEIPDLTEAHNIQCPLQG